MEMEGDIGKMMEQLRGVQDQLAKVQEELAAMSVTAEAGGGMVSATANGRQQLVSIKIEKEVIDVNEKEMLEDLVVAAVNRVMERARELSETKMSEATRGFLPNIPGL